MLFRRFLGGDVAAADPGQPDDGGDRPDVRVGSMPTLSGDTATVRRIVARLEALPADQARYLAGFAYVMSRAAHADLEISAPETQTMEQFVSELSGLDEAQAVLVVEMAKLQTRHHGATEDFLVTREFGRRASREQKLALLRCCFAVGAADETISAEESGVVNQIANELDVERDDLNRVRSEFHERLSTIQAMRRMATAD